MLSPLRGHLLARISPPGSDIPRSWLLRGTLKPLVCACSGDLTGCTCAGRACSISIIGCADESSVPWHNGLMIRAKCLPLMTEAAPACPGQALPPVAAPARRFMPPVDANVAGGPPACRARPCLCSEFSVTAIASSRLAPSARLNTRPRGFVITKAAICSVPPDPQDRSGADRAFPRPRLSLTEDLDRGHRAGA